MYFEPKTKVPSLKLTHRHHLEGCAHGMLKPHPQTRPKLPQMSSEEENEIKRLVEELCGLGGVAMASRNTNNWDDLTAGH